MGVGMNFIAGIFIIAALVFVTPGCKFRKEGRKVSVSESQDSFNVVKLFTVDGCSVYRFDDGHYSRYFTNCKGTVEWTEKSGKSKRPMSVSGGQ